MRNPNPSDARHSSGLSRRAALACGLARALRGADAPAGKVQFVFGTYGMKTLSTHQALQEVARAGYDGVELSTLADSPTDAAKLDVVAMRELRKALESHHFAVPALLDNLPLVADPAMEKATHERIRRIAEVAHGLVPRRPPVLDTVLGGKPADWDAQRGRMAEKLHAWARVAEASKLTIAIKPHASHAMNSPQRALYLLREVPSPRIRLVYDYSHFRAEGFTLEESLRQLIPSTVFISVKDSTGHAGSQRYLLPGEGDTDYARYFQLLSELRYSGGIGVEVSSMIHRQPGYDPVRTTQVCYERIAPFFGRSGLVRTRMPR